MFWPIFALASGVAQATQDALTKKVLGKSADRYMLATGVFLAGSIVPMAIVLYAGLPHLTLLFWFAVLVTSLLNVLAFQLQYHALAKNDFSLVLPMMAFSPAFNIVSARLIVGDHVSLVGGGGVLLVVLGSFLLHSKQSESLNTTLKTIIHSPVARTMLLVALIFSIAMPFNKMAVGESSPVVSVAIISLVIGIMTACLALWKNGFTVAKIEVSRHWSSMAIIGMVFAVSALLEYFALSSGSTPYVMSVKRLSILVGMLYGWFWFNERFGLRRGLGGAVMLAGHATIILGA